MQLSLKDRETGRLILLEEPLSVKVSDDAATLAAYRKPDVAVERTLVEIERAEKQAAKQQDKLRDLAYDNERLLLDSSWPSWSRSGCASASRPTWR